MGDPIAQKLSSEALVYTALKIRCLRSPKIFLYLLKEETLLFRWIIAELQVEKIWLRTPACPSARTDSRGGGMESQGSPTGGWEGEENRLREMGSK